MEEHEKPHHDEHLAGEKGLLEADNVGLMRSSKLTLTTHRILLNSKKLGAESFKSIMLEDVCSCEVRYKSYLVLLVAAAVFILIPYYSVFSLIFIGAYFFTRGVAISLASSGVEIDFKLGAFENNIDKGKSIVESIEAAKSKRLGLAKATD